jgi:hypothetical protein
MHADAVLAAGEAVDMPTGQGVQLRWFPPSLKLPTGHAVAESLPAMYAAPGVVMQDAGD